MICENKIQAKEEPFWCFPGLLNAYYDRELVYFGKACIYRAKCRQKDENTKNIITN